MDEFRRSGTMATPAGQRLRRRPPDLLQLLPNAMAPVIVAATFGNAYAILIEAGLSFLGLGVQPQTASYGRGAHAGAGCRLQ
jgi:hypothetical protein